MGVHRRVKTQDGVIVASVQMVENEYEVTVHSYVGRIGDYSTTGSAVDSALDEAERTARKLLAKQKQVGFEHEVAVAAGVDVHVQELECEVRDLKSANAYLQLKMDEVNEEKQRYRDEAAQLRKELRG